MLTYSEGIFGTWLAGAVFVGGAGVRHLGKQWVSGTGYHREKAQANSSDVNSLKINDSTEMQVSLRLCRTNDAEFSQHLKEDFCGMGCSVSRDSRRLGEDSLRSTDILKELGNKHENNKIELTHFIRDAKVRG